MKTGEVEVYVDFEQQQGEATKTAAGSSSHNKTKISNFSIQKKSESYLEMAAVQRFLDFKNKIKNTVFELNVTYCPETRLHIGLN